MCKDFNPPLRDYKRRRTRLPAGVGFLLIFLYSSHHISTAFYYYYCKVLYPYSKLCFSGAFIEVSGWDVNIVWNNHISCVHSTRTYNMAGRKLSKEQNSYPRGYSYFGAHGLQGAISVQNGYCTCILSLGDFSWSETQFLWGPIEQVKGTAIRQGERYSDRLILSKIDYFEHAKVVSCRTLVAGHAW